MLSLNSIWGKISWKHPVLEKNTFSTCSWAFLAGADNTWGSSECAFPLFECPFFKHRRLFFPKEKCSLQHRTWCSSNSSIPYKTSYMLWLFRHMHLVEEGCLANCSLHGDHLSSAKQTQHWLPGRNLKTAIVEEIKRVTWELGSTPISNSPSQILFFSDVYKQVWAGKSKKRQREWRSFTFLCHMAGMY